MKFISYCYQQIAKPGSGFYYSLKKIPKSKRDAVVVVAAFYHEIENIILSGTDLNVSYFKLNWWRVEISKLRNGIIEHPIALALKKITIENNINTDRYLEIIDGLEQNLNLTPFPTFEECVIHVMRTAGVRELLIIDILNPDQKIPLEMSYQLTLVIELTYYLQRLRDFARRHIFYFPADEMRKFQVTETQLLGYKTTKEIAELLQYQAEKIARAYRKASAELTPQLRADLAPLLARCKIASDTLTVIKTSGFTVLENYIKLTPLRKWWSAFWV